MTDPETQRMTAIGIVTLAAQLNNDLARLERALGETVGEVPDERGYFTWTMDAISEAGHRGTPVQIVDDLIASLAKRQGTS